MKIIYPERTEKLLAEWDKFLETLAEYYKRNYSHTNNAITQDEKWYREMQASFDYQWALKQKAHVLDVSTYKVIWDDEEIKQWDIPSAT